MSDRWAKNQDSKRNQREVVNMAIRACADGDINGKFGAGTIRRWLNTGDLESFQHHFGVLPETVRLWLAQERFTVEYPPCGHTAELTRAELEVIGGAAMDGLEKTLRGQMIGAIMMPFHSCEECKEERERLNELMNGLADSGLIPFGKP